MLIDFTQFIIQIIKRNKNRDNIFYKKRQIRKNTPLVISIIKFPTYNIFKEIIKNFYGIIKS